MERLARMVAIAGGMLMIGVVLMTVISILARYLFNAPIPGDYEITELALGITVFAFSRTATPEAATSSWGSSPAGCVRVTRSRWTWVHNVAFTLVAGLITWRLLVGGMHKLEDGETTLFLGIPIHWAYFSALLGAGLLTAICVLVVYRHVHALRR